MKEDEALYRVSTAPIFTVGLSPKIIGYLDSLKEVQALNWISESKATPTELSEMDFEIPSNY